MYLLMADNAQQADKSELCTGKGSLTQELEYHVSTPVCVLLLAEANKPVAMRGGLQCGINMAS